MAQLISIKLSRFDGSPWGFRLQGGKDFGTPLVVQKVNNGSPAEAAGLRAGDAVIRVNSTDMFSLRHKDAQDVIVRAGNNFEMTVQRGSSTWRPSVSPVTASIPSPQPTRPVSSISPVTKTSLAAKKQDVRHIGSGHNFSPKPFLNGMSNGTVKSIVNKQYNSPVGMYSEETIAETLSAQAEVLAGGVLGVNFKKNEKNYDAQNSEVFKMVQEADKEPRTPEPAAAAAAAAEPSQHSGVATPTSPALTGLRHVQAPESRPPSSQPSPGLTPGQNICAECERLIVPSCLHCPCRLPARTDNFLGARSPTALAASDSRPSFPGESGQQQPKPVDPRDGQIVCSSCDCVIYGVFVRIKEKNLHVECFKCATCGTSLKNVGYYNINNKLYCDIHAKLVARQNAPPNVVPVTVAPGQRAPANTISAALSSHGSSSPQPFSNNQQQCQYQHRNGYNSRISGIQDEYERPDSVSTCETYESKTYTSTITIQTTGTQADNESFDYNRNFTNDQFNNMDNKLHKLTEQLDDFSFDSAKHKDQFDYCPNKENNTPAYVRALKPIRLGSSPFDQPTFRPVQAPSTHSFCGPKPFIGSSVTNQNYSSPPIINTGSSSTLPRPQNLSVTGRFSTLPKPKSSPFNRAFIRSPIYVDTLNLRCVLLPKYPMAKIEYYEEDKLEKPYYEYRSYESVQEVCRPKAPEKPPTPRNFSLKNTTWPPTKAIEDITYPTASPLYIDPNSRIDPQIRQVNLERRATVESVISREHTRRCNIAEQQYQSSAMDQYSCPGPQYRRVELVDARQSRETSRRCDRPVSRTSSTDSVRRSLTPTRITQPVPRPWTATVTSGTNLYETSYEQKSENICRNFCDKEVCQREKVCQRERSSERSVCQREPSCEKQQQQQQPPAGHHHHEQHMHRVEDTCKTEGDVHSHEHKTSNVCRFTCESDIEEAPEPQPMPAAVREQAREDERLDLSKIVPPDVAICPKGIDAEHDLYTEIEEEDKDNLHIKKTTTYEKTVELVTPDREGANPFAQQQQDQGEVTREEFTQRSSTVDREVEGISDHRHVSETTETLSKRIESQRMIEEARKHEEVERQRRAEEERRQRYEEEQRRQAEEREIAEMYRREEQRKREKEEADRQRYEEEQRRMAQEQAERSGGRGCRSEQRTEIVEEYHTGGGSRERIIDVQVEGQNPPCSQCSYSSVEIEERPPSRERIIPIQREVDEPPCKKEMRQVTEEVNIKQHCEHRDYEEQRRKSLREQVEVHQSLRQQQQPRQQSLQERRLCSRFRDQGQGQQQQQQTCSKKHVQFVKQTDGGPCPLPSPIVNSTPKEWKSEMCKALTTAPDQPYSPLGRPQQQSETREVYRSEVTYEQNSVCSKCHPQLPPEPQRAKSPFVEALTTASDRPYSPLGREVDPNATITCRCRSQTPDMKDTYEGYSAPTQILYRNKPKEPPRKPEGPRPLPTPPPDFKFRNRSVSPACRSRSQTPSGRISSCGLKRPDNIPIYQKHLVCEEQAPVQEHDYPPSRNSTPACCSAAAGPAEPPACVAQSCARKPEAACTREQTPDRTETTRYHYEEDTPQSHKTTDTVSSKTMSWVGQHQHFQVHDDTVTEECDGSHHVRTMEHKIKEYDEPDEPSCSPPPANDECYIAQNTTTTVTLPCPTKKKNDLMDRIKKTGVRVIDSGAPEVRRICHQIPPPAPPKPPCPMTGVQVLPVRAHGDTSCKSGVVVVPCDGIGADGVHIKPTADRSGVCVSPCQAATGGICKKPKCYCGSMSNQCTTNLGNVETTRSVNSSTSTQSSCNISGYRSVSCPKTPPKCLGASRANLPFPQIPLPEEDPEPSPEPTPPCCQQVGSTTTTFSSNECTSSSFKPIQQQPRTNLCNQITTLTLCKRESKPLPPPPPPVPTVQLYKPSCQTPPPPPCRTSSSTITQNRFRRETTTTQSQNRTQTQTRCQTSKTQSSVDPPNLSSHPDLGAGCGFGGNKGGTFASSMAPNRGRGILNQAGSGLRIPLCAACNNQVRGPFISALGQIWCPEHFVCTNSQCRRGLQDIGFVEEKGQLYCEYCFERFIAPPCDKCNNKIKGDCLNAIGKHFHPECFNCAHCGKHFGNSPFFLEEGLPYCERDWNDLFTTKCFACGFPVEAGDRWVEALNNNYHSQCFNCTMCKKNLEGQSFYAKGGRPFCKNHAR
ncbi:PDZ and LIM domain protein Zasp-like [Phymastichus coffea]|uniref:PDZ and LIM domain protein Zasp-like n=1 Tax=Phymastichus coffea TaxID=108790 RepID=UPI00273CB318|nr:PDZ and LIM domain protein Zasp-like [Phymastichus coffea]